MLESQIQEAKVSILLKILEMKNFAITSDPLKSKPGEHPSEKQFGSRPGQILQLPLSHGIHGQCSLSVLSRPRIQFAPRLWTLVTVKFRLHVRTHTDTHTQSYPSAYKTAGESKTKSKYLLFWGFFFLLPPRTTLGAGGHTPPQP